MLAPRRNRLVVMAAAVTALALTACGGAADDGAPAAAPGSEATRQVTDLSGTVEVPASPERIVATDNRIFRTLDAWDVDLVAAPVPLVPAEVSFKTQDGIIDLGNHREPNLEGFIAATPDLVLNGGRFITHEAEIRKLLPETAVVNTTIDAEQPLDAELKRQATLLGDLFGRESDAERLTADLDASIERAQEAYNSEDTVMGLLTSGGDISYAAPGTGRSVGPVFPVLGLTPALETAANDTSHGDDISVEAIAEANPDWLIVLDRDAAVQTEGQENASAKELIERSEALASVTAVQEGNIVYLPANFYVTEDIQAYTELFNAIADAMGRQG
ncbi:MAG: ABC transporter substrate-binding protein [Propionibacteriaceae bacterium]|nr:ABC transporter substrate-binding protein [Propionibacteriaceae bacterium]